MLKIYRRHLARCVHRSEGRDYRRCKCPVWVDGLLGREDLRESLKTGSWDEAHRIVQDWKGGEVSRRLRPSASPQRSCVPQRNSFAMRGLGD